MRAAPIPKAAAAPASFRVDPRSATLAVTRTLFAFPLESDEYRMPPGGRFCVYRSRNSGDSWEACDKGLPRGGFHAGVLRSSIACDAQGRVFVGSTAGTVHVSDDLGDTWRTIDGTLPRILSVSVLG